MIIYILNLNLKLGINIHPAGEWLLDNYYIIEETYKTIKKELSSIIKDKKIHKGINRHGGEFGYTILDVDFESKNKYKSWSELASTSALASSMDFLKAGI